jgi:hypothetical protein
MIKVIDMTGKVMIYEQASSTQTIEISTGKLTNGLYVLQLRFTDDTYQHTRFVK